MTKGVRVDFLVPRGTGVQKCKDCKAQIAFVKHPKTQRTMCLDVASRVATPEGFRCEVHQAHCPSYIARQRRLRARRQREGGTHA